ncbi:hypothetical protein [Streptomyces sp. TRM68416]|uniref:hypothetical protein n=2 Tax=unclassified Streptomyces TaxID=2593676 RepID=UPI001661C92B|nr:hypothetical protein [Streptomyces sp. TRM68416]MBD0839088.1 hypothetical protein [Streptomyces sp. TRM68416]
MWLLFAYLMIVSYGTAGPSYHSVDDPPCKGPLFEPVPQDSRCDSELRQWPALLGILALTLLATVVAAATLVYARVAARVTVRSE